MTPAALSARLRTETKALHTEAERSGVMGLLLRGRATRDQYLALLVALEAIYGALEDALAAATHDATVAALHWPGLARRDALRTDLAALRVPGRDLPEVHPGAADYATHLRALAGAHPPRLLAHAWLRYLGDLNGGQIVARIVRESLALPDSAMRFYAFDAFADPPAAAAAWRATLDAQPFDEPQRADIVEEACDGFQRHIRLFRGLAGPAQDAADDSSAA